MTNIVMITRNRRRLATQTLISLLDNTRRLTYNLTIIDDASEPPFDAAWSVPGVQWIREPEPNMIVGDLKNKGIAHAERFFGRGEYLYLTDNDVYFKPGWLDKMISALIYMESRHKLVVLGGIQHPYHGDKWIHPMHGKFATKVVQTDAVAGYSMLMRWDTWDKYGPFDANAIGVCQSEDFAFCQKAIKDGKTVGYIHPHVILHCGITNTEGKPSIGSEAFIREDGIIYE